VEDGVQYILGQFIKRDVIALYNPAHVSDYTRAPVSFKAFILGQVPVYCRGLREVAARSAREPLLLDAGAGQDGLSPAIDAMTSVSDQYPSLADDEALERLRAAISRRLPEPPGRAPVLPLFDALADRYGAGKPVTAAAVRARFKVTPEAAEAWMAELRGLLGAVTAPRPLPAPPPACFELGGMLLTALQVREAVKALRDSRGNRVLPAFADTGHPLAAAGRQWYLDFAAQVMRDYPKTRAAKGGHYEGGHFGKVKAALIFGLERLLDGLEAEPISPPDLTETGPWRAFEEALGGLAKLPGVSPADLEAVREAAFLLVAP
jgi:hypothetical protein